MLFIKNDTGTQAFSILRLQLFIFEKLLMFQ